MGIKCQNDFCIYEADGECMSNETELDFMGKCDECIFPNIPKSILEHFKETTRKSLENDE